MTLRLYDLAGADPDRRFSPYCWRTRLALAHKRAYGRNRSRGALPKRRRSPRRAKAFVPVLVDGDRWIADSWTIANYLEDTYPDRPSLLAVPPPARPDPLLFDPRRRVWSAAIFPFIALDILRHRRTDKDRDYFRTSREKRVGMTLEAFVADREAKLPAFRASLTPLRLTLKRSRSSAATSRSMPTMPCSAHSNGHAASARSRCWTRTIRSGCGAIACSIVSTALARKSAGL